jgi:hypothetical protein
MMDVMHADGKEYGPYTGSELLAYVEQNRIKGSDYVRHPEATKSKWVPAEKVQKIKQALEAKLKKPVQYAQATQSEPATPEGAEASIAIPKIAVDVAKNIKKRFSKRVSNPVEFFFAFVDPGFRYYVTPIIIRVTWCAWLVMMCLFILTEVLSWVDIQVSFRERLSDAEPNAFFKTLALIVASLWVRVVLESTIVFYDISNALKKEASD